MKAMQIFKKAHTARRIALLLVGVLVALAGWPGEGWTNTTYDTPAVTATAVGPYQIDIQWVPISGVPEVVYGQLKSYGIVRAIPSSPNALQSVGVASTETYTFTDNTVTPGHAYLYSIWPNYATEQQPYWNLRQTPATAPASPTGLPNPNAKINPVNDYSPLTPSIVITGTSDSQVSISWEPFNTVLDAVYGSVNYYSIGRSTPDYPNYIHHLGSVSSSSGVYSYSDNTVVSGDQYIYVVVPAFSSSDHQPILNYQGSPIVVIPYLSSSDSSGSVSISSSGSSSSGTTTSTAVASEIQPTTIQGLVAPLLASTVTNQPVIQYFSMGPQVLLNGQPINFDVQPEIKDGRTFVPVRALAHALGVTESNISWDNTTSTVTIAKGDLTISLTIGSSRLIINGQAREMDVAPYLKDGRTIVPLRFIVEAMGAAVEWDDKNQQVIIKQL